MNDNKRRSDYQVDNKNGNLYKKTRLVSMGTFIIKNKEDMFMEKERNKTDFDDIKGNYDEKRNITEKEWILLEKYRNLCEENKLTIDILIQRLLTHQKGRE